MKISGHRTRAVFDRYNIVSSDDVELALQWRDEYHGTRPTARKVVKLPR